MDTGEIVINTVFYTGRDSMEKRRELASVMRKNNSRAIVITDPQDVCWLLNIRVVSPSVKCKAVFLQNENVLFFVNAKCEDQLKEWLWSVEILPLEDFDNYLENYSRLFLNITVDMKTISSDSLGKIKSVNICNNYKDYFILKSYKNTVEITNLREANRYETDIFNDLKERLNLNDVNDYGLICKKIETLRNSNEYYIDGYLRIIPITDADEKNDLLFILEMGGEYLLGETKATRTVVVNSYKESISREIKDCYTAALKLQIALAIYKFMLNDDIKEVCCKMIDEIKKVLPMCKLSAVIENDFGPLDRDNVLKNHQILSIQTYSSLNNLRIQLLNSYVATGEEDTLFLDSNDNCNTAVQGLEILTMLPFDINLIDFSVLTPVELEWLDIYNKKCLSNNKI